jgi:hypothetical protein
LKHLDDRIQQRSSSLEKVDTGREEKNFENIICRKENTNGKEKESCKEKNSKEKTSKEDKRQKEITLQHIRN